MIAEASSATDFGTDVTDLTKVISNIEYRIIESGSIGIISSRNEETAVPFPYRY
ncbi:MAG: hypothetical protein JGK12_09345 [Microcoleus sp. PH2017_01_SCD_O_A]|uniref:hypothetical protein n=1 Tax=unclassified Microcoleus TaxID=2642155 RepID=UPI001E19524B|nr:MULTISPECIES: hypothetical protein [unclassified Microcoleus]MCC3424122.1 hypothetical protein [Microcoleus sp. PH2017_01_SCD_O_A]MCC3505352.1 hypothetical protein [Microcoleus sp. PH2017_19_SFW_U_A]MCC3508353.1 hypothetical protein [Microcoleus sp. PH2017_17_BER_D_A]MCC3544991.1 hypothetical protein [Microcoleus sp. PH2017_24_DOB_U_A]MCC3556439.1 hypothetical protein [Microcoleus sp. PH2017_35_SFW_U_B]